MNKRLQALRAEHDRLRSSMEAIENPAAEAGVDLTDDQLGELNTLSERANDLARSITEVADREDRMRASSDILARLAPVDGVDHGRSVGGAHTSPRVPTPGEYAVEFFRAATGDSQARENIDRYRTQFAEHTRALQNQTTADNAGVLPTPIVGDLTKFVDASRPVIAVMRDLPMPAQGKTFVRPRVTQRTLAAAQAAEFDVLSSRKMTITGDNVTKATHGTAISLSEQDIDWTDPALLQIVSEDLAESYAIDTEATAEAAIAAGITSNVTTLSLTATAADFQAAIASAAASVYATAKRLPDVLFAAVDRWAYLAGLTDTTGRPIFPNLNPVNAPGGSIEVTTFAGNPLGLKLAVGPSFATNFFALGVSHYCEAYEQDKGLLQIEAPSTLSMTMAYRGYFATNVRAEALQGLVHP